MNKRLGLSWLLSSFAGVLLLSTAVEAASLRGWRFDRAQNQLEFTTDIAVQPRVVLLANPTRLVIDLPGIRQNRDRRNESLGEVVRGLRIAQFDRQTARIVIDIAPGYTIDPLQVLIRGAFANQWTVQLPVPQRLSAPPAIAPDIAPSGSLPPPQSAGADRPILVPPPQKSALAPVPSSVIALPPPVVDPPLPQVPAGRFVVVIDPGHGGPDPGAVGIDGLREVDVVMPISFQVTNLLRQQGVSVVLTREDDIDLGLEPRVQIARRAKANLFVSIHANAISMDRPDINGVETYYHGRGEELAVSIHRRILEGTGVPDRRVRRSRFYVLRRATMPAVLLEVGFVTGAEDAIRLRDPIFLNQMSVAIARGILDYLTIGR